MCLTPKFGSNKEVSSNVLTRGVTIWILNCKSKAGLYFFSLSDPPACMCLKEPKTL